MVVGCMYTLRYLIAEDVLLAGSIKYACVDYM